MSRGETMVVGTNIEAMKMKNENGKSENEKYEQSKLYLYFWL